MVRFLFPALVGAAFAASASRHSGTGSLPPAPFGTVRFRPAAVMANFTAAGGGPGQMPGVVAAGAILRFASSSKSKGTGTVLESVLSALEFPADVLVDAHIAAVARHPATPEYEALPTLLLASVVGYNQTSGRGPRTQNLMKLHSTINESWFELQTFDNATGVPADGCAYARAGAQFGSSRLRLVRRGALAWGGVWVMGGAQQVGGWWGAAEAVEVGPQPTQHPLWVGSVLGSVRVGLAVQSDYTSSYQVDVAAIDIRADADRDGLSDAEEAMIGSSASNADTDLDGTEDWDDLLPLDPTVGAVAVPLFANLSLVTSLRIKVTSIDGAAHIILNNTANEATVPGRMNIPRLLAGGAGCATVVGGHRALPCTAGAFSDDVPLPPWGRIAYKIQPAAWDGVLVDVTAVLFPASSATGSVHQTVDLRAHIVSVLPNTAISGFKVMSVGLPSIFGAVISDEHNLVVSAKGSRCGSANVSIEVTIAWRRVDEKHSQVALTVQIPIRKLGRAGPNLIQNGNFTGNITQTRFGPQMRGWTTNTWSGLFKLQKCPPHVPYRSAPSCVYMHGMGGAGKFGLMQENVELHAGTYSLSAVMAAVDLEAGQWSGTTSLYASFTGQSGPVRPDFTGSTRDLLSGSSGWRQMNATFSLPTSANATLYFFIWGSGRFFLQDVVLTLLGCHLPAPDNLTIGAVLATLNYDIPLTFEDTLLCGFCNDTAQPAYNRTELCAKCAVSNMAAMVPDKQAGTPKLLTDFTRHQPGFFAPDANMWQRSSNGTAELFAGCYMSADSSQKPVDWSAYSFLNIDVFNPNTEVQPFSVELRDTATVDYWSRVNWNSVIAPGSSTFTMPIDVYVGEKSEISVRRRIDLKHITRLAVASAGPLNISLMKLTLVPQPGFVHDFPKLLKMDMQPRTGPVLKAFTGVYPDTLFESRRAYGIANQSTVCQNQDREHPDDLLRDWMAFSSGGIDFQLPPGKYGIWFIMEDAGYWEYYQNWRERFVTVSGGAFVNQSMDVNEFWKRYYFHSSDEDLPGQSSWERYIKPRYLDRAIFLQASVGAGERLSIRFSSQDFYGCTLSALLMWPMAYNATANLFLRELEDRLRQQYDRNYVQVMPSARGVMPPRSSSTDLKSRLVFFSPLITDTIEANGMPRAEESVVNLNVTVAAKGEAALMVCFVDRASDSTAVPINLTSVSLGRVGALTSTVQVVRYKQMRLTADGAVWANKPRLLIKQKYALPLPVTNVTRCLWIEVHGAQVPASKLKVHSSTIVLSFASAGSVSLPLTITELPTTLPSAVPLWIGYLGMLPLYPETDWPEVQWKRLAELEPSLALMADNGFSAGTGGAQGPAVANETLADMSFASYKHVFGEGIPVNSYLGSAITGFNVRDGRASGYAQQVKEALTNISAHAKRAGWPEFFQTCGDEPQGDSVAASLAVGDAFAAARELLPSDALVGKTSVFTSVLNLTTDSSAALLAKTSSIDLIVINEHSAEAIHALRTNGHSWMLYNQGSRFHSGFYLAMASHLYDCRGLYQFAFSSVGADPYYALDAREDDLCAVFTTPPEQGGDLVMLLETVQVFREGVNDLRYTMLLRKMAAAHSSTSSQTTASRDAVRLAQAVLAEIDKIPLGSQETPWSTSKILATRRAVERAITGLVALGPASVRVGDQSEG